MPSTPDPHDELGRSERIVVVDLFAVVVALRQAHGVTVADVHSRKENHLLSAAVLTSTQIFAKLASIRRPCVLDFSG